MGVELWQVLVVVSLGVLPGAWLTHALPACRMGFLPRLALAVVLSPLVIVIEFYVFRLAGVSFAATSVAILIISFASLPLVCYRLRRATPDYRRLLIGTLIFFAVAACAAIPWLWDPHFRRFSWHGLLHTDIVYAFANGALLPDDPELAGVRLAYPWMGHIYWAVVAWASDLNPTVLYLLTNFMLLWATGALLYLTVCEFGVSTPMAFAMPVFAALGANPVGLVGWSIAPPNADALWWALFGDLRYAPFLLKYVTFEVMTFGLAAFAALLYLSALAMFRAGSPMRFAPPLAAATIGVLYPILFPPAFALTVLAVAPAFVSVGRYPQAEKTDRWRLAMLILAAAVVAVGCLTLYTAGQSERIVMLSSGRAFAKKLVAVTLAQGIFFWLAWRVWRKELKIRWPVSVLALTAIVAVTFNLGLRIGSGLNEYKFLIVAGMCIIIPAAVYVDRALAYTSRYRWALLGILPVALAVVMATYSHLRIPKGGTEPTASGESSFWLMLPNKHPDASWTRAIRERTPLNTIVITDARDYHVSSFTGRVLFAPLDGEKPHFGYNMYSRHSLLEERGYNPILFEERVRLLKYLYGSNAKAEAPVSAAELLMRLRSFGRPLAMVLKLDSELLAWLQEAQVGRTLAPAGSEAVVYYVPTPTHISSEIEVSD